MRPRPLWYILLLVAGVSLALLWPSLGAEPGPVAADHVSVSINPSSVEMTIGSTVEVEISVNAGGVFNNVALETLPYPGLGIEFLGGHIGLTPFTRTMRITATSSANPGSIDILVNANVLLPLLFGGGDPRHCQAARRAVHANANSDAYATARHNTAAARASANPRPDSADALSDTNALHNPISLADADAYTHANANANANADANGDCIGYANTNANALAGVDTDGNANGDCIGYAYTNAANGDLVANGDADLNTNGNLDVGATAIGGTPTPLSDRCRDGGKRHGIGRDRAGVDGLPG